MVSSRLSVPSATADSSTAPLYRPWPRWRDACDRRSSAVSTSRCRSHPGCDGACPCRCASGLGPVPAIGDAGRTAYRPDLPAAAGTDRSTPARGMPTPKSPARSHRSARSPSRAHHSSPRSTASPASDARRSSRAAGSRIVRRLRSHPVRIDELERARRTGRPSVSRMFAGWPSPWIKTAVRGSSAASRDSV